MKKTTVFLAAFLLLITQSFAGFADEALPAVTEAGSSSHGLVMSTEYPSRAVMAGDSLEFQLDFENPGNSQLAELFLESVPEGWTADFLGDGDSIGSVYLKSGATSGAAALKVKVPMETETGLYEIRARAAAASGSCELTLKLGVQAEETGESGLVIEYSSQKGSASTTFSYSTTIQNNTAEEQNYSLTASVPKGWTSAFSADGTQVAAVTVPARSSQNLTVNITPSAETEAGEYTIPVSAISATENLSGELKLTITGNYQLSLSTPSSRLSFDATANKQSAVTVSVTNSGNIDLQNINLSSTAPTGWTVEYSESSIPALEAGATKELTVYVTPAEDALSGDYALSLTAKNAEASSSAAFRVTVKTETKWGIVGGLIILAVLGVLAFCFKKFGRR